MVALGPGPGRDHTLRISESGETENISLKLRGRWRVGSSESYQWSLRDNNARMVARVRVMLPGVPRSIVLAMRPLCWPPRALTLVFSL